MKLHKLLALFVVVLMSSVVLSSCGPKKVADGVKPTDQTTEIVESKFAEVKPTIDGKDGDELWQTIEPVTINLESSLTFEMKSSYDDQNVYFLFKWISPDKAPPSLGTWLKKDGNWTWEFVNDTFSIVWDAAKMPDFAKNACTPLCHDKQEVLDKRYMGPDNPSDLEEIWEWSPGVTNPLNIMASYLLVPLPEGVTPDDANFNNKITYEHLSGEYGYYRNRLEDASAPAEQIVGDKAPLYIINGKEPSGEAAMVKATGTYEEPFYILECARPRTSSNTSLTQFDVPDNGWKDILFATAIHFKAERDLHKTMKVGATFRMVGKNAKSE